MDGMTLSIQEKGHECETIGCLKPYYLGLTKKEVALLTIVHGIIEVSLKPKS